MIIISVQSTSPVHWSSPVFDDSPCMPRSRVLIVLAELRCGIVSYLSGCEVDRHLSRCFLVHLFQSTEHNATTLVWN